MFVRKIFHTGVTRSMTYVAIMLGNQCSSEDDVISTSLRRAGSMAHASPQDRIDMNATYMYGGVRGGRGRGEGGKREKGIRGTQTQHSYIHHTDLQ